MVQDAKPARLTQSELAAWLVSSSHAEGPMETDGILALRIHGVAEREATTATLS